jgi:DNA polymerase V
MHTRSPRPVVALAPIVVPAAVVAVACGFPSPAQDYATEDLDLTEHLIRDPANTYVWPATDLSMVDAGIFDTSVLLVDRGLTPVSGDLVIANCDGEYLVRRLAREHGVPVLRAEGFAGETLLIMSELEIWGVVTWVITGLSTVHTHLELFDSLVGVDLGRLLIRDQAATYEWRAAGHSMTGVGILDQSLLLVDRGLPPIDGGIVVAIVDGEHTVKQLDLHGATPVLRAANPGHPDIGLAELSELTIWGTVAWSITKARVGSRR